MDRHDAFYHLATRCLTSLSSLDLRRLDGSECDCLRAFPWEVSGGAEALAGGSDFDFGSGSGSGSDSGFGWTHVEFAN